MRASNTDRFVQTIDGLAEFQGWEQPFRLTRQDLKIRIQNLIRRGGDTSEEEKALAEMGPPEPAASEGSA